MYRIDGCYITPQVFVKAQHQNDIKRLVEKWDTVKQQRFRQAVRRGADTSNAVLTLWVIYSLITTGDNWHMGTLDLIAVIALGVMVAVLSYNWSTTSRSLMEYYFEICNEIVHLLRCNPKYAPSVAESMLESATQKPEILRHALNLYYMQEGA